MKKKPLPALHNNTSDKQLRGREKLKQLFAARPMDDELLLTNFGLFARSSALAKLFFLHEAYKLIRHLPGDIYVFGVWLGQDVVTFESMRAMLEPYNASRKIIGFDTFEGYPKLSEKDRKSEVVKSAGYWVPENYKEYLEELLAYHRSENTMGHAVTHTLVQGDVTKTIKQHLDQHPESMAALVYLDLALHEPTAAALKHLNDRLMPGSVVIFDEINDPRYPGETIAFREWIKNRPYEIRRSEVLPDRTFVILK